MIKPLCFVLMPFGKKPDGTGRDIDFDSVYKGIIHPAITQAGLEPIRADEELVGGLIHKPMYERLLLCDYAVADLTIANANVLYELGIRHAMRPRSTVMIFAEGMRLPFDVAPLRGLPYALDSAGLPGKAEADTQALSQRLEFCKSDEAVDSPLFQVVSEWPKADIAHLKTDEFRARVTYSTDLKEKLSAARLMKKSQAIDAVGTIETQIDKTKIDPALLVDLMLSYRHLGDHAEMIRVVESMPKELKQSLLVQEQYAFALNRKERREEAEAILKRLINERGPSSETNGILGRVYKDQWAAARATSAFLARGFLTKAINTYLEGFQADWRDAYPGINAATLMEVSDPVDPRQAEILPIVRYAVKRRLEVRTTPPPPGRSTDEARYWDFASLVELEVLASNYNAADQSLSDALACNPPGWMAKTTLNNLRLIHAARQGRGVDVSRLQAIEDALEQVPD